MSEVEDKINKQAHENAIRRSNELAQRVADFEEIKKEHLTYVKKLQKQVEVLKGALVKISCNAGDGQDNELVPCCAARAALKQCEEMK